MAPEIEDQELNSKRLEKENGDLKPKLKEYEDNVKLFKEVESSKSNCTRCNELMTQIRSLKQKNNDLKVEASKYQSALGIATNFDLSVDDQNHSVKLNKDILELHDTLENYVTNLKPRIDVNINEAKKLLNKYGCRTKISDKDPNKPLIKAVLQRHVLEEILVQANFYFECFKCSNREHHLESNIVEETAILTGLMERLYNNRLGNDEVTRLIPIRLRQQVYTALSARGLNDIKESTSKYSEHDFVHIISKKVNAMMNKYRVIKDIEKRKEAKALAVDLVRNVVRIFFFRLPIQEPVVQYRWFNDDEKINKSYMKGSWDDDEIEDLVVEVCSFPMIFRPLQPDGFNIFTPAKVFPRHFIKKSISERFIGKFKLGIFKKIFRSNDDSVLTLQDDLEQTSSSSDSSDSDESN